MEQITIGSNFVLKSCCFTLLYGLLAYSTETYWLTVLYALHEYSRKTFQFTLLYALLCTVRENVLALCDEYIVMHIQEKICWLTVLYTLLRILKKKKKKKRKKMLLHCTVYIVMHSQEKRVGSLCCMHCYGSGSR